jgi:hypothetical protein
MSFKMMVVLVYQYILLLEHVEKLVELELLLVKMVCIAIGRLENVRNLQAHVQRVKELLLMVVLVRQFHLLHVDKFVAMVQ